jgi:hypothetical protein
MVEERVVLKVERKVVVRGVVERSLCAFSLWAPHPVWV